ncbi:MAG: heparin lyase I family protein [Desulfosarcina sp.]|nr:heparin lyase I family protein [Desulfobacterales bacterium]
MHCQKLRIKSKQPISNILYFIMMLFLIINSHAHAEIIFYDGFENQIIPYGQPGNVWKPVNVDSGTIVQSSARYGQSSLGLTLNYDDNWGQNPSSELSLLKAGAKYTRIGGEYWYRISIYLPENFQSSGNSTILLQFFPVPDTDLGESWKRHPVLALSIKDDQFQIGIRADANPVTIIGSKYDVSKTMTIGPWPKNKWTDFVFNIKWSYRQDGILRVWNDDKLVVNHDGPNCFNDTVGPAWKIGPYEWYWRTGPNLTPTREVYYDEIKIGDATSSYSEMAIDSPPEPENDMICSVDLNGDGDISEDEIALCFNVGDDYLCPLGAVDCAGDTCPLGDYACIPNSEGVLQCSPHPCSSFNPNNFDDEGTTEGENDKTDDGPVDENGNCLGTLYIFSGNDKRCRMPGISTQFKDCCTDQYSSFLFSMDICNSKEEQLVQMKEKGLCYYIGSYCSKRIPLVGCVQKKKTYCCFHSKLSRIINEQGRPQLQNFGSDGGWGEPKNPDCRGFTPEEFRMLNFSLIDLSEWYGDITTRSTEEIQNSMQQKVKNFYE